MRHSSLAVSLLLSSLLLALAACGKKEPVAATATPTASVAVPVAAAPAQESAPAAGDAPPLAAPSLVSFAAGAWIVKKPQEYGDGYRAFWLIDERADTMWATPANVTTAQELLLALPEQTVLQTLEFDTAAADCEGCAAKDIVVEVSDSGPDSGFKQIAALSLEAKRDRQRFAVAAEVPGRWVKLVIRNNHGSPEYLELADFRAYGKQLTQTPLADVSGTYETSYGPMHLRQEGSSLSGCYEFNDGLVENGGLDGRVMRFNWSESSGDGKRAGGPAVMAFAPDGKEMLGLYWDEGRVDTVGGSWAGKKKSGSPGTCPQWKAAPADGLARELEAGGRVRLYGIQFDTDAAVIKPDSKPTLERIVKLAQDKPEWKFAIEGHTDSTASAAHNQGLSERRAQAVSAYLVQAGVAAERLRAQGLGASQPVADNGTTLGRSQNRRVELVRQ